MKKTIVYFVNVMFGDCDPAGILRFSNYLKWMDALSLNIFTECGVPSWRELVKTNGIIGTPLLEINPKFQRSATYGEALQVHTRIEEWRDTVVIHRHIVKRGEALLCEGTEVRAFCMRQADKLDRITAISIPADIKALCC